MYNLFINNLAEKLIKNWDYTPLEKSSIKDNGFFLKRKIGDKTKYVKLYCDNTAELEKFAKILLNNISDIKSDEHNMYVFVFLKKPSQDFLDKINFNFSQLKKKCNYISCVVICLEEERILLNLGIVFPNHSIIEAIMDSLKSFKNSKEQLDINKILKEKNQKPESTIAVNKVDNFIDSFSYKFLVFSLFIWGSLKAINVWTGIFGNLLGYSQILIIIATTLILEILENNFGQRKLIILTIIGGLSSFMLVDGFEYFYNRNQNLMHSSLPVLLLAFISQTIGGVLYMKFRIKKLFTYYKSLKYVFGLIGVFIISCMFSGVKNFFMVFVGAFFGFILSGVLGFENEVKDYSLKNKMGFTFILIGIPSVILFLFKFL